MRGLAKISDFRLGERKMMDFDYPSGKNQRFLPPPLTRGGFRGAVVIGTINSNLKQKTGAFRHLFFFRDSYLMVIRPLPFRSL